MNHEHDEFAHVLEAWLDISEDHEDTQAVLGRVAAQLAATPQRRVSLPAWRGHHLSTTTTVLAAAAVTVVALFGYQFLTGPNAGGPAPTSESSGTPTPTPSREAIDFQAQWDAAAKAGFWGLPPEGAIPSFPERGELVEIYPVHGGQLPFEGSVRLYADGRLIWYMFDVGPIGQPFTHEPTGYIEQRLTAEGVELVRTHDRLVEKDPMFLSAWLPASAWRNQQMTAFVPSGYAACIFDDASRGLVPRLFPTIERSTVLELLPAAAAQLLSEQPSAPEPELLDLPGDPPLPDDLTSENDGWDCIALTTRDARQLASILDAAGVERYRRGEGMVLEYGFGAPALGTTVTIVFEPIFPDGTINCSDCG